MGNRSFYRKVFAYYSVLWLVCTIFLYLTFRLNGKSLFWLKDGFWQHYVSFDYLCGYLEGIFKGQGFKMYDFTIGQGADIVTTLGPYDFLDPVSIVTALLSPVSRELRYGFMIFIKLYLIGISFITYCLTKRYSGCVAIIIGAIAYTFSGSALIFFARHPNFINWMYFFPFMLAGIEIYYSCKKRYPLIITVFLNILTNYYTFYICAILSVLYLFVSAICNYLCDKSKGVLKSELKKVLGVLSCFLVGVLLSAVVLLPSVYAFLNNSRVGESAGQIGSLLHFDLSYYWLVFQGFFIPYIKPGYSSRIGLNPVMFLALGSLFLPKASVKHKIMLGLSTAMLMIPFFGKILNGFGYVSNRWSFVIVFYFCAIFVESFTEIIELSSRNCRKLLLVMVAYIGICMLYVRNNSAPYKYLGIVSLVVVVLSFCITQHWFKKNAGILLLALTVAGSLLQIWAIFSPGAGNYLAEFLDLEKISEYANQHSDYVVKSIDDANGYRVEEEDEDSDSNNATLYGIYGTKDWWSVIPSEAYEYYNGLELNSVWQNCNFVGLGGRAGLLEIAGVKYYTRHNDADSYVPFGYEQIESPDEDISLYENKYSLPIGFAYSKYISDEHYQKLDGISKEYALLNGCALEQGPDGIEEAYSKEYGEKLDYEIAEISRASFDENEISIKDGGYIRLSISIPADNEVYLRLDGITLSDSQSYVGLTVSRTDENMSVDRTSYISNKEYNWYVERNGIVYDLGRGDGYSEVTIEADNKTTFKVKDISFTAVPLNEYIEPVHELGKNVLENVSIDTNEVT